MGVVIDELLMEWDYRFLWIGGVKIFIGQGVLKIYVVKIYK